MPKTRIQSYLVQRSTGKKIQLAGCRPSKQPPPKSRAYAAGRFQAEELPPRVDLRHYMTAVEDQSEVNSCTANAIAGAYEYLAKRILGKAGDVSRLFIYYNARKFDGIDGDSGSTISGSIQVLQEMGACTELTWPYNPDIVDDEPHFDAYDEALNFLVEHAEEIPIDLYAMKHCLAEGYPFVFGLRLFKSFDKARRKGGVPMPDPGGEDGRESHGNHAMLCVGYSDPYGVFVVRNSWGEEWGDRGYCYIPYDYMTNPEYCWDCWTIKGVSELDFTPEEMWYDDDEIDLEDDGEDDDDYDYYEEEYEEEDDEDDSEEDDEEYDNEGDGEGDDDENDSEEDDEDYGDEGEEE